jgi:hypothetical protein
MLTKFIEGRFPNLQLRRHGFTDFAARFLSDTIARNPFLCSLGAGSIVVALRACLRPAWPIPIPSIYDEFAYLLQAGTFAHSQAGEPFS